MVSSQSSIDNEVFTKVYDHIRPPLEAYYYVPTGDYVKVGAKAKGMRKVFGGDVEYDNYETEKLAEFQAVLKSKNWTLPEDWDQTEILRILEGKISKTWLPIPTQPSFPLRRRCFPFLRRK